MGQVIEPNSIAAIRWGLQNYDGAEFDVRITKDNVPIIHHDTYIHGTLKKIQDLTCEECINDHKLETLEALVTDPEVIRLCNEEKRFLWLELKPDCEFWQPVDGIVHATRMYGQIDYILEKGGVDLSQINIFSFNQQLCQPFVDDGKYRVYAIVPFIDECDTRSGLIRKILSLPRFFAPKKNLIWHGKRLKDKGFDGMLFPNQYVTGIRSLWHPSLKRVDKKLRDENFDLVTQTQTLEDEQKYDGVIRFTDHCVPADNPRQTGTFKNHIVIHRGCGVDPLEIE
ncbi:MAG: glycerophosphodiester phosphodiesterase [Candidatus Kariarchaeaceae archaeon]|jgi:hypothetical protein